MCDLNWCCVCDKAISCDSQSLYCSQECFTKDATNESTETYRLNYLLHPRASKVDFSYRLPPVPELSPTFSCASDISSPTLSDKLIPLLESEDVPKLTLGKSACIYCEKQEQHPKNSDIYSSFHQISSFY